MFPSYLQTVRRIILTDNREAAIVCVRPASQSLGLASMRIAAMRCGRIVDKSQTPKRIVGEVLFVKVLLRQAQRKRKSPHHCGAELVHADNVPLDQRAIERRWPHVLARQHLLQLRATRDQALQPRVGELLRAQFSEHVHSFVQVPLALRHILPLGGILKSQCPGTFTACVTINGTFNNFSTSCW